LGAAWLAATPAPAATKGVRIRAASQAVQEALRCEVKGENEKRDQLLQSALEQVPDFAPALWQSGRVKHQNQWVRFDQLPDLLAEDSRTAQYRHRRQKAPQTVEGQLALAQWCARHKLEDQARAHLTAVLEIDPEHPQARHLLGYHRVDGTWLSAEEMQQAAVRAVQAEAALKTWKPEIEKILQGLTHRSRRQREVATERLMSIADPGAIHAMELVLSTHSEETALLVVQVVDKIQAHQAAVALARQGVFSQWDRVREEAAKSLRLRDPAHYVPVLLSGLSTPVQGRAELYRAPSGRLRYRHAFYREGQEQAQLAVFETEYPLTVLTVGSVASYGVRAALLNDARRQDAAIKAQAREAVMARQNEAIRQSNERICRVLSKATGKPLLAIPERWWQWWNDYNEVYVPSEKPIRQAYHHDIVRFDDPAGPFSDQGDGPVNPLDWAREIDELPTMAELPDFELPEDWRSQAAFNYWVSFEGVDLDRRSAPLPAFQVGDVSRRFPVPEELPPDTRVYLPPPEYRGRLFVAAVREGFVVGYEPTEYPTNVPFLFREGWEIGEERGIAKAWGIGVEYQFLQADNGRWYVPCCCLVAGTAVWTEAGLLPIEEVEVGDRVLSQDPQSGELAYKPVLKTTVRPPARMVKVVFGDEALQCGGGHPFWIAGKGWIFARDLEEGAHLHAVEGAAEVRSVHPTGYEQLHNLVVADFHTYFVTEAKILTHDNTIREPTNALVPGLVGQGPEPASEDKPRR
jgi:hypothetical protein